MTLSRWLRDYLYIPLGGNRKGTARTYVNLMITMLLGGLWHGAAWHFVVWGGLHGVYLAVGHWKQAKRDAGLLAEPPDTRLGGVRCSDSAHVRARVHRVDVLPRRLGGHRARRSLARSRSRAGDSDRRWSRCPSCWRSGSGWRRSSRPHAPADRIKAAISPADARCRSVVTAAVVLFVITTLGPRGVAPFIYFQF